MIEHMYSWCFKWKLKLNIGKSNVIHFRPKRHPICQYKFKYGETPLIVVPKYKYLGIYLDQHLSFDDCTTVLSDAAGRALGGVINKFKEMKDMGFETFEKMYETAVTTVNDYAAEIWGYKHFSHCNNVQNRAMRYYLGVHRFAPIASLQGDFGWLRPRLRRYKIMLNYWNRLIKMNDSRLTKYMYEYDYQLCKNNWCSELKDIFTQLDMNTFYEHKLVCDITLVKRKLFAWMKADWQNDVQNKPKLRTYRLFKADIDIESYIKYHMSKRKRSLLAQFRFGILPLRIETGRYTNTPVDERICILCKTINNACTEDEYHFLMECPLYADCRAHLEIKATEINYEYSTYNSRRKFTYLLLSCQKYVANFIDKAWEIRKTSLYVNNT